MNISWQFQSFSSLTNIELYHILALRQKIFIVEQQDIYLDADEKDFNAVHLSGHDLEKDNTLVAYARILLPVNNYTSFGRVIVDHHYRGKGLAKILVTQILSYLQEHYSDYPVKISAQTYLTDFYKSFGFEPQGEIYLDGRITHIDMVKIK